MFRYMYCPYIKRLNGEIVVELQFNVRVISIHFQENQNFKDFYNIRSRRNLEPDDWRLKNTRFAGEAFTGNCRLADIAGDEIAKEVEATPVQVAPTWILSHDVHLATIPGTRRTERLK